MPSRSAIVKWRRRSGVQFGGAVGLPLLLVLAAACDTLEPSEPGNLVPATVSENAALPAIELKGARFHARTFGDPAAPVIVFLHGGPGGDHRGQLRLAARYGEYSLADEYFLVFWDQRGAGLSQRHGKETLTIAQYVADLDALIDRFSPGRQVFLVGDSWGGMYATRYINDRPQRVAGAVLIEPGPLDGPTMERLKSDMADFSLGAEWLNDIAWAGQFISPDDHARMDFERMLGSKHSQPRFHLSRTDPEPVWRMGAAANRYIMEDGQNRRGIAVYDFTTNLTAFTTPVLFIAGSLSEVLGPSLQQQQIQRYPSASLVVVDGVGHDAGWVRAAEVVTHIRTYLDARKGGI
jgi:proline iminopeptidase